MSFSWSGQRLSPWGDVLFDDMLFCGSFSYIGLTGICGVGHLLSKVHSKKGWTTSSECFRWIAIILLCLGLCWWHVIRGLLCIHFLYSFLGL